MVEFLLKGFLEISLMVPGCWGLGWVWGWGLGWRLGLFEDILIHKDLKIILLVNFCCCWKPSLSGDSNNFLAEFERARRIAQHMPGLIFGLRNFRGKTQGQEFGQQQEQEQDQGQEFGQQQEQEQDQGQERGQRFERDAEPVPYPLPLPYPYPHHMPGQPGMFFGGWRKRGEGGQDY